MTRKHVTYSTNVSSIEEAMKWANDHLGLIASEHEVKISSEFVSRTLSGDVRVLYAVQVSGVEDDV